ncbi:MAG: C45 family autoproteolytic acyltransferase/hydrolase [Nitrospirota bacterium]
MDRIALLFLSILLLSACAPAKAFKADNNYVYSQERIAYNNAYLEIKDNTYLLHLKGSHHEMGYQYGKLLGYKFDDTLRAFESLFPKIPLGSFGRWLLNRYVYYKAGQIEKYVPAEYIEEMKGMADSFKDYNPDYRILLFFHVLHDIGHNFASSAFAVSGEATPDRKLLIGRNADLGNEGTFDNLKTIVFYEPDKGNSFVSICWPAMVGVISGINDKGIVVSVMSSRSNDVSMKGMPISFLLKKTLQYANNIDEAVKIISETPRMSSSSIIIGDGKTNEAVIVEASARKMAVRKSERSVIFQTNHYVTELYKDDPKNIAARDKGNSMPRFKRLEKIISENYGSITKEKVIEFLRDHSDVKGRRLPYREKGAINRIDTSYSILFSPSELKFYLAAPPGAYGRFMAFDLKGRIEGDYPEDLFIKTNTYKNELLSEDALREAEDFINEGYLPEAVDQLKRAITYQPDNYFAYKLLGELYLKMGLNKDAEEAFKRIIEINPPNTEVIEESRKRLKK